MNYISTIAKYEAKTLSRSWFFRIFAIISIFILSVANLAMFSPIGDNNWSMRAVSSFIPQANLLYFNLFQSIIAIFIASDFMKRDKNQDTAQVFYIRSMSNMEYVLGKLLGVLKVFVLFNILIMLIALLFNVIATGVSINIMAYIYFFLLINIPSLMFILGLSFFLMSLIKNQAITYLVLFAYVGGSLFGFGDKTGQVWDYMSFYLPMSYSDLIGFANLDKILLQRGSFLFLGFAFVALSVLMLNRLPQSKMHTVLTYIGGIVSFVIGFGSIGFQVYKYSDDIQRREDAIALNNKYFYNPAFTVSDYDIDLSQKGKELEAVSVMRGEVMANANDTIVFSLNEGLELSEVKVNGKEVAYTRKNHLVLIPGNVFNNGRSKVEMCYSGTIDQTLCYLDVEDNRDERMVGIIRVPQIYAVVDPDYVLLTTESLWYPLPSVTHTTLSPAWESFNFSRFNLKVKTEDSLVVVSQGDERILDDGTYCFRIEQPMARISITAGHFEKHTMLVDKTLPVNLYIQPGHDYYSAILDSILDTIPALTADALSDFESNVGLYYPYKTFNLVETPIQFTSHTHLWAQTTDNTQPMVTLIPEHGAGIASFDFKRNMKRMRFGGRNNEDMTEEDKQIQSYNSFLQQTFFRTSSRVSAANTWESFKGTISSSYSIFPNYHYFSNHIASKEFALLNVVMESYFYDMFTNGRESMRNVFEGSTEANKAAKILQTMSFQDFLKCDSLEDLFSDAISMKGKYLFSLLESKELDVSLDDALDEFLGNTERSLASFSYFSDVIYKDLAVNFKEVWKDWIIDKGIPSFVTTDPVYYRFRDEDANCYQVIWKVSNVSETNGVVTFTFRSRRGGGRGPGMGNEESENVKVLVPAGKTLELAKVFDNQPGMMTLDYNVSKNLPTTQMVFSRDFKERQGETRKEYQKFSDEPIDLTEEGEIVVDNEDKGFVLINQVRGGLIKNWIDKDDEEVTYQQGWGQISETKWTPYVDSRYYGASIKSAYKVEGGNGGQKAEWKVALDSSAYYSIYTFIGNTRSRRFGPPGMQQERNTERNWEYYVIHEGETEEAILNLNDATSGWNLIGTYYFDKADTARVVLTNNSTEREVVADAVKWVME